MRQRLLVVKMFTTPSGAHTVSYDSFTELSINVEALVKLSVVTPCNEVILRSISVRKGRKTIILHALSSRNKDIPYRTYKIFALKLILVVLVVNSSVSGCSNS